MKLVSLKSEKSYDGDLVVISQNNQWAVKAGHIVPSLREAVEKWDEVKPALEALYADLNNESTKDRFKVDQNQFHSPLPRSFQWADGSAYIHHIKLVRKARNAPLPETLETVPLMYHGGSDNFLTPRQDIPQIDFSHGTDLEGEVAVVVGEVPMGVTADEALNYVKLVM